MPNKRKKGNINRAKTRSHAQTKPQQKTKPKKQESKLQHTTIYQRPEYKSDDVKKVGKDKKDKKLGKKKKAKKVRKHPKLILAIKIFFTLIILAIVVVAGIVAAIFFNASGEDFEITKDELKIGASNSVIVDPDGNKIADLSGDEKRKVITLEEMSEYLPNAYIAIEDERFRQHDGVDIKRTAGAIFKTLTGNKSFGGSSITQQLVKNITKDDTTAGMDGIKRKIREWAKAYQVERLITKDEILELYLNIIYVGEEGNLHGVELAAEYYFDKSAKDLDLAECAFLAGINSSPNYYNPYKLYNDNDTEEKRAERIKNKTLTVLKKMKDLGYVQDEEVYNAAVSKAEEGLPFEKGNVSSNSGYTYHTEAVINQVINQVVEEKEISEELAKNYVYSSGLTIYSTVDPDIQEEIDDTFTNTKLILKGRDRDSDGELINEHSQAAMAVVDFKTGQVKGIAGGVGEKTETRGLNRATQSVRQCGSSMKPLATIAPALEEGIITAATAYDDCSVQFGSNYRPKNYNYFTGITNIRRFIATSQNIPALKIMAELTPEKSIEYLNKMGIKSLNEDEDAVLSLALGGTTNGATPLEMAAAYGTIANDGVYITPTFYTKVVDSAGNVVLEPKQEKTRVISEENAYITKTIVQEPVKSGGTATYCAIPGMDTAAKTGTTDDDYDRWLCGFTPYYSAAVWFGYDRNEEVRYSGTNPAGQLWDKVMTNIHRDLSNASFERPDGIVTATVCRKTGCLACESCTDTYKEIFTSDNMPEKCEGHGMQTICTESGLLANEYCPDTEEVSIGGVLPKEKLTLWKNLNPTSTSKDEVEDTCTIHKKPEEPAATVVVEKTDDDSPATVTIEKPENKTKPSSGESSGSGNN